MHYQNKRYAVFDVNIKCQIQISHLEIAIYFPRIALYKACDTDEKATENMSDISRFAPFTLQFKRKSGRGPPDPWLIAGPAWFHALKVTFFVLAVGMSEY